MNCMKELSLFTKISLNEFKLDIVWIVAGELPCSINVENIPEVKFKSKSWDGFNGF
jgi:hypothetical protein